MDKKTKPLRNTDRNLGTTKLAVKRFEYDLIFSTSYTVPQGSFGDCMT